MKEITILEFLQMTLLLGSLTYIIGTVVFIYFLKKLKVKQKVPIIISHFISSFIVTIILWISWKIKLDIVYSFLFLPTLVAEILITVLFVLIIKIFRK